MADRADLTYGLEIEAIWRQDRPTAVKRMEQAGTLVSSLLEAQEATLEYQQTLIDQGWQPADAGSEAKRAFVYLPDDPEPPLVRDFPSRIEAIWRQDRPNAVARMERDGILVDSLLEAEKGWADYVNLLVERGMTQEDADSKAMSQFVYLPDDPERPVVRSFPPGSLFWDYEGILVVCAAGEGKGALGLKPDGSLTPISDSLDERLGPESHVSEAVWRERAARNYSLWRKRVAACA